MAARQVEVAAIIAQDPDILAVNSSVGVMAWPATSNRHHVPALEAACPAQVDAGGRSPAQARSLECPVSAWRSRTRRRSASVASSRTRNTSARLQGSDLEELYLPWSNQDHLQTLRRIEGLTDVTSNLYNNSPTLTLDIDRDKLPQLGLTVGQVQEALTSSFSTRQVSTIYGSTAQYQVILEVAPEYQKRSDVASKITCPHPGQTGAARRWRGRREPGPTVINHRDNCPRSPSVQPGRGVALGDAVDRIRAAERELHAGVCSTADLCGHRRRPSADAAGLGVLLDHRRAGDPHRAGHPLRGFIHLLTILSTCRRRGRS